jgi:tRNA pseudouridine55 synthase
MQGLLLLNKPGGITSFAAVSAVKRTACQKRVGHTGTLDPMATGVLPVLLGRATALSSLMLDSDKRYIAKIKLGITTDTEDITGNVLGENVVNITTEELDVALSHFTGKIKQKPPMYSALKKDGVRLYDLARKGETVDIPERDIEIFSINMLSALDGDNCFIIDVHVSKGTYIRSLARDIGEYLGCGATLSALERTYAAGFDIDACVNLDELNPENIGEYILNEEIAVKHLREVYITQNQAVRFCNGGQLDFERLKIENISENELFRVKCEDKFLGIAFADFQNKRLGIKCIINFWGAEQK